MNSCKRGKICDYFFEVINKHQTINLKMLIKNFQGLSLKFQDKKVQELLRKKAESLKDNLEAKAERMSCDKLSFHSLSTGTPQASHLGGFTLNSASSISTIRTVDTLYGMFVRARSFIRKQSIVRVFLIGHLGSYNQLNRCA